MKRSLATNGRSDRFTAPDATSEVRSREQPAPSSRFHPSSYITGVQLHPQSASLAETPIRILLWEIPLKSRFAGTKTCPLANQPRVLRPFWRCSSPRRQYRGLLYCRRRRSRYRDLLPGLVPPPSRHCCLPRDAGAAPPRGTDQRCQHRVRRHVRLAAPNVARSSNLSTFPAGFRGSAETISNRRGSL